MRNILKQPKSFFVAAIAGLAIIAGVFAAPASAQTGDLNVCKAAGTGITAGTNFTFTVDSQTLVVPAGQCVSAGIFSAGTNVTVQETVPSGDQVTSIAVGGSATLVSSNLSTGNAVVQIGEFHNSVTFTNAVIPTAGLDVCKVAGTGVTAGTNFTFAVNGQNLVVPAGQCRAAGQFPIGSNVTVVETIPSGVQVSAITVGDSATLVSSNLGTGTAVVGIGPFHNTVTFTDQAVPQICTVTKGFYRNHPTTVASIIAGLGGSLTVGGTSLTTAQVQAILDATPGQPGNVTFTSNLLLNTTQQLITALLNLNGNVAAAPASVQAAIAAAQAGIDVTIGAGGQIQITTTLTQTQLSDVTATLTNFNEGKIAGFPSCPEE